jgi:hypothetical protein
MHPIHPPIMDSHYFHAIPLTAWVPFWSCDSDSFFSHMQTCPRSAATLADQFSRNSAHETRKIRSSILRASILGATGPYNGIIPLWRRCAGHRVLRVMAHACLVSCGVPQPLLQCKCLCCCCECLWAAGEGKRGAAVVVDLVHRRLTANISHDQHPQIITIPLSPNKPS